MIKNCLKYISHFTNKFPFLSLNYAQLCMETENKLQVGPVSWGKIFSEGPSLVRWTRFQGCGGNSRFRKGVIWDFPVRSSSKHAEEGYSVSFLYLILENKIFQRTNRRFRGERPSLDVTGLRGRFESTSSSSAERWLTVLIGVSGSLIQNIPSRLRCDLDSGPKIEILLNGWNWLGLSNHFQVSKSKPFKSLMSNIAADLILPNLKFHFRVKLTEF